MIKKIFKMITAVFLIIGTVASCSAGSNSSESSSLGSNIFLIKSESYYSGFKVKNDKVYITCYVTLENKLDIKQKVKLLANFPNDINKLLKSSTLPSEKNVTLNPNSKGSYNVIFVGEFAGTNQKHDRLLPDISIKMIN